MTWSWPSIAPSAASASPSCAMASVWRGHREEGRGPGGDACCRRSRRCCGEAGVERRDAVADRRHRRAGQLHRRARRPGRGARARRRRSACRWPASPRQRPCWRGRAATSVSPSPPSTAISATGFAHCRQGDGDGAVRRGATEALRARLAGRPCLVVGPQAEALAPQLVAAGIDAVAAAGLAGSRRARPARRRSTAPRLARAQPAEGLPRPLYLRGVNVTSPDGARRTVE